MVLCQSDLLDGFETRFVVPLGSSDLASLTARRLNPIFNLGGERLTFLPQFASTVTRRELGPVVGSLAHHSFEITDAIDVLLSGV